MSFYSDLIFCYTAYSWNAGFEIFLSKRSSGSLLSYQSGWGVTITPNRLGPAFGDKKYIWNDVHL